MNPGEVSKAPLACRRWERSPGGDEAVLREPATRGRGRHGLEGEPSDPDPDGDPRPWMDELPPGSPGPKKQQPFHCPRLQLGSSQPHDRTQRPGQRSPGQAPAGSPTPLDPGAWLKTQLAATRRTSKPFPGLFKIHDMGGHRDTLAQGREAGALGSGFVRGWREQMRCSQTPLHHLAFFQGSQRRKHQRLAAEAL